VLTSEMVTRTTCSLFHLQVKLKPARDGFIRTLAAKPLSEEQLRPLQTRPKDPSWPYIILPG
jgi:hypothetical protein